MTGSTKSLVRTINFMHGGSLSLYYGVSISTWGRGVVMSLWETTPPVKGFAISDHDIFLNRETFESTLIMMIQQDQYVKKFRLPSCSEDPDHLDIAEVETPNGIFLSVGAVSHAFPSVKNLRLIVHDSSKKKYYRFTITLSELDWVMKNLVELRISENSPWND